MAPTSAVCAETLRIRVGSTDMVAPAPIRVKLLAIGQRFPGIGGGRLAPAMALSQPVETTWRNERCPR
jgi:hypothetical protein